MLDNLKKVHDFYATTIQILTQRVQFYAEEFDAVKAMLEFYHLQLLEIKKQIAELEPKSEEQQQQVAN